MERSKLFQLAFAMLFLFSAIYAVVDGSILGLGTLAQKNRYITFDESSIEFLFMLFMHLFFGIWLLSKMR